MGTGYKKKVYYGYLTDDDMLKKSSSGGISYALAAAMLYDGGYVCGVKYIDNYRNASYCVINKIEEIEMLQGTKYIMPELRCKYQDKQGHIFDIVRSLLENGKKVLFFGTGCIVGGLIKSLKNDMVNLSNLSTVDLICHGPAYKEVHQKYIEEIEKRYNSKIIGYNVRNKSEGWNRPKIEILFENGQCYERLFYKTDFGYAFKYFPQKGCCNCVYKGDNHMADITVGDFWGITEGNEKYNYFGVSAIIINSENGENMIKNISNFHIGEESMENILKYNPMYYESKKYNEKTDFFLGSLSRYGLHKAVQKNKLINIIKSIGKR